MTTAEGDEETSAVWSLLSGASFDIGGDDQAADLRSKHTVAPENAEHVKRLEDGWRDFVSSVQIRAGTLLKTDTVSLLLGAGAAKDCGGVLIGTIPLEVERTLLTKGVLGQTNRRVQAWLRQFYLAVARAKEDPTGVPTNRQEILERHSAVMNGQPNELPVNFEILLSLLHRWRAALPRDGGRLRLDGTPGIDLHSEEVQECLKRTTRALADRCRLPANGTDPNPNAFRAYTELLRKLLSRPLNLKRINLFTLNYDTLVEQAADAEGVVLIDGFVGTVRRIFRPESYDQDLYFPAETTEGRVHRLDRVAHLYKLHGSVTWTIDEPAWNNPYGVVAGSDLPVDERPILIYPTPTKVGETLGMPYAELFRRFACAVVRPQSTLFVLGYGFGDEHVRAIIRQAMAVPSFTLVIADPDPKSHFVQQLRDARDRRVWIFSGKTFGAFSGFVEHVLPDLRDEDVRLKVMATYRALRPAGADGEAKEVGNV
jgi:hypothetical protein